MLQFVTMPIAKVVINFLLTVSIIDKTIAIFAFTLLFKVWMTLCIIFGLFVPYNNFVGFILGSSAHAC